MSTTRQVPTLLTLPAELRNEIYGLVWDSQDVPTLQSSGQPSSFATSLRLESSSFYSSISERTDPSGPLIDVPARLKPLGTCRQIRHEATVLALNSTPFHFYGTSASPEVFDQRARLLSASQLGAIKTLSLTAKIATLRALNESWAGVPFGHPCLVLDKLILIPQKPDASPSCYAEVADLSQCHTLAYVLAEALKGLKNVKVVEVRNDNCFKDFNWRLLYRCLVYRMWKWGGLRCGLKFVCSEPSADNSGVAWFKIVMTEGNGEGHEAGAEICRLIGKDGVDPGLPAGDIGL